MNKKRLIIGTILLVLIGIIIVGYYSYEEYTEYLNIEMTYEKKKVCCLLYSNNINDGSTRFGRIIDKDNAFEGAKITAVDESGAEFDFVKLKDSRIDKLFNWEDEIIVIYMRCGVNESDSDTLHELRVSLIDGAVLKDSEIDMIPVGIDSNTGELVFQNELDLKQGLWSNILYGNSGERYYMDGSVLKKNMGDTTETICNIDNAGNYIELSEIDDYIVMVRFEDFSASILAYDKNNHEIMELSKINTAVITSYADDEGIYIGTEEELLFVELSGTKSVIYVYTQSSGIDMKKSNELYVLCGKQLVVFDDKNDLVSELSVENAKQYDGLVLTQ